MNYLEVGGIYKSDLFQNRSIRIVVIDEIQILYETGYGDSWKSEVLLDSSFDFQVISTGAFLARKPEKLRVVRYSDEQQEVLRPDLPISVGRNQKLSWGDVNNLDEGLQNEFKGELKVSNIYIHPYGPKGGDKRAHKLTADNSIAFKLDELIEKCARLQCQYYYDMRQGIGVFRRGIRNGFPSFYINGYYSRSDAYKLYEERFDWSAHFERMRASDVPVEIYRLGDFGIFQIKLNNTELSERCSVLVVKGRGIPGELRILNSGNGTFEIDLRGHPPGSYRLEFWSEDTVLQFWMLTLSSTTNYPLINE